MNATALHEIEITSQSRRFRAYPASRRCHIWGIPAIPSHWQEKPLKRVATINFAKLSETTDPNYEIEYVDIGNVNLEAGITSTERYPFERAPSRARRRVGHGDTIISTVRTYLKAVAQVVNPPENFIVSTGFAVLRASPSLDPGYLYRLAQSEPLVERIMAHSVGVSYPAINASDIGKFAIPIPPLDEQRAISAFLDGETARIDELITTKRRLLQAIDQRRIATMSKVATRGLVDGRPMKSSGVDWLGDVPATWNVVPLKRLAQIDYGLVLELDRTLASGTPIISLPNVTKDGQLLLDDVCLADLTTDEKKRYTLKEGVVPIVRVHQAAISVEQR